MKVKGSILVLFVLLAYPASASMVSFLLVETGINQDIPSAEYTSIWEGGLMAAFFDAGHIITNSPITRMEKKPPSDLSGQVEEGYFDAVMGGADYFVLGFLEYKVLAGRAVPVGMVLKIYNTSSNKIVYEQNFPAGSGTNNDDEFKIAQNAGRTLVSHLGGR